MLFADDASVATYTEEHLQTPMNKFSRACKEHALTVYITKTKILAQDTDLPATISIDSQQHLPGYSTFIQQAGQEN